MTPEPRRGKREESPVAHPDTGEILTAAYVESEIMRLSANMDSMLVDLRQHAQDMADAEHKYKVEFSKRMQEARLTLDGDGPKGRVTVDQAECHAIVSADEELRAHLHATAIYDVDKEILRSLRSQVDALRTVAANIRAQS